ncbi:MAG: amino acid permease [Chlamydiota bacterium]
MRQLKTLTVFSLAMINVAAIGSVKNWPLTAEYGFSAVFFLILAALTFFFPVSLIAAELATAWPKRGGVFVWVKEAFGHRTGFLAIWLLWVENVIWYPTILSFIAATLAYAFAPSLADNKLYTLTVVLVTFWGSTLLNLRGMRTSSIVSTIGSVCGTFVPGLLIIGLGAAWYFSGNPIQITFSLDTFIPNMTSPDQMVFFTGVLLSFAGMEMSAIHARDVQNPRKDYPKAIFLSVIFILGLSILGVLAIAMVVPQSEISLVAGSIQAFHYLVDAYHLSWLTPLIALFLAFGAAGSVATWTLGPVKGLLAAAEDGDLPPICRSVNSKGMPSIMMIIQACIVTVLSMLFLFAPSVSSGFWILTALVSQIYLIMYLLMFAAAIKLRYKHPRIERPYRIPGGNLGMWVIAGIGILASLFALFVGFFPPVQLPVKSPFLYVLFLVSGLIIACVIPSIILLLKKPEWAHPLSHEKQHADE